MPDSLYEELNHTTRKSQGYIAQHFSNVVVAYLFNKFQFGEQQFHLLISQFFMMDAVILMKDSAKGFCSRGIISHFYAQSDGYDQIR